MIAKKLVAIKANELGVGQHGVVSKMEGLPIKTKMRLLDLGITEGVSLRLLFRAPFGDPVCIEVRRYKLCIRKDLLDGIIVMVER